MEPSKVFLTGAPADAELVHRLAQAFVTIGTPVFMGPPSAPFEPDAPPAAVVLVISPAALTSPDFAATIEEYRALAESDPSVAVVPVMAESVTRDALPLWLRDYEPVTAPDPIPDASPNADTLVQDTLRRLGVSLDPDGAEEAGQPAPIDTVPTDSGPSADMVVGSDIAITAPIAAVALGAISIRPPQTRRQRIAQSIKQELQRRGRPFAIGVAASLVLLLIACVAFSLGVGSPAAGGADRLDSGAGGGGHGAAATASATQTATVSGAPTASPTRARSTATHVTPSATGSATAAATPTPSPAAVPTATDTPTPSAPSPTPTATPLPPGTGLRGDYFHSSKVGVGTPVPYPTPIIGSPWFSRTDTIIDMGYGKQSHTYTPPLAPFDPRVCPSPPTSSPCAPFAVRWTGFVRPRYTETYTFTTDADDGVKLWINGQLLVDNWQVQGDTAKSGTISLTADQLVSIQIEYYENGEGPATMVLQWQSASQPREVIPQSQLYPPS
jgi:hypothetical protein